MAPKHFMTNLMDRPDFPLVATAIHSGHALDDKIEKISGLSDAERLPEEDPFTDLWTAVTGNRIIVHHSRFEVDLNRPREKAVYLEPEDAWGLNVWKTKPSPASCARTRGPGEASIDHRGQRRSGEPRVLPCSGGSALPRSLLARATKPLEMPNPPQNTGATSLDHSEEKVTA